MSSLDDDSILFSLSPESSTYIGRHPEALRRFAAAHPVEAGLIINALVGGMVQSNAHSFMRGLSSEPPRSQRTEDGSPRSLRPGEGAPRTVVEEPQARSGPPAAPSAPPRPSQAPFSAALYPLSGGPSALGFERSTGLPGEGPAALTSSPPANAPEPPDLEVGDQVQHRWLGVGVVERIWWRDDHWHVATDRFGAPASRLKRVAGPSRS